MKTIQNLTENTNTHYSILELHHRLVQNGKQSRLTVTVVLLTFFELNQTIDSIQNYYGLLTSIFLHTSFFVHLSNTGNRHYYKPSFKWVIIKFVHIIKDLSNPNLKQYPTKINYYIDSHFCTCEASESNQVLVECRSQILMILMC